MLRWLGWPLLLVPVDLSHLVVVVLLELLNVSVDRFVAAVVLDNSTDTQRPQTTPTTLARLVSWQLQLLSSLRLGRRYTNG